MANNEYVINFDRQIQVVARKHQRSVTNVIRGYGANVLKALKTQHPETVIANMPLLIPVEPMRDALLELWLDAYVRFSKLTTAHLTGKRKNLNYKFELKRDPRIRLAELLVENPELAAMYQQLMEYFTTTGAARVITIVETYQTIAIERIKEALQDITALGLGENEGAKLMNRYLEESWLKTKFYAQRIVRTETHSAANYSSHETATKSGAKVMKVWSAYLDSKTRATHIEADGQEKAINEPFEVGMSTLMMPGDPRCTDASLVINCRCVISYKRILDQYDQD